MKVLLLEGTGAMGKHLVHILTKNGGEVFVTSHRNKQSKGNLRYIYGNAQELFFLQDILSVQKWDVIVDFMVYSTKSFEERVEFLLNNTKQYVFLSSARVYADSNTPITETSLRLLDISEDEEYLRSDEYALAKARQENILINSGKKNWTEEAIKDRYTKEYTSLKEIPGIKLKIKYCLVRFGIGNKKYKR